MGFTPAEVGGMSLWEFNCCICADQKTSDPFTDEEAREMGIDGF